MRVKKCERLLLVSIVECGLISAFSNACRLCFATGETFLAISPFHFLDYSNFCGFYHKQTLIQLLEYPIPPSVRLSVQIVIIIIKIVFGWEILDFRGNFGFSEFLRNHCEASRRKSLCVLTRCDLLFCCFFEYIKDGFRFGTIFCEYRMLFHENGILFHECGIDFIPFAPLPFSLKVYSENQ